MNTPLLNEKIENFNENYKEILDKIASAAIKSGRKPEEITLLAATKTVESEIINHAFESGISVMGENRVQEFLSKNEQINKNMRRQFIGTLQTNKVKQIVGKVELIQSVDSVKLAKEISRQSKIKGITTDILVEINIANEESKGGINENMIPEILCELSGIGNIRVKGLMTLGPVYAENDEKNAYFSKMQKLFIDNQHKKVDNISIDVLSMGMSDDFETAILCGSNMIRLGSALFGKRIYK